MGRGGLYFPGVARSANSLLLRLITPRLAVFVTIETRLVGRLFLFRNAIEGLRLPFHGSLEIADFGVVGDLFTVVPQLLDEVAKRK